MNNEPVAWIDYLEHSDVYDLNVSGRGIPLYTHPAKTQEFDCYGDGNLYRGVRSKDSEIQTIHIDSTAMTLTDEEYKPLTEADVPYQKVAPKEVADAIDKAFGLKTLTDEEIKEIAKESGFILYKNGIDWSSDYDKELYKFARTILQRASEK